MYVPNGWITEEPEYLDVPVQATWHPDEAELPGVSGRLSVLKDAAVEGSGYAQLTNFAEMNLPRASGFERDDLQNSKVTPITLADGTHAVYAVADFQNEDHRSCHHHLFAMVDETSDVMWWMHAEVTGPAGQAVAESGSETNRLLAECVKSFVPGPAAE